MRITRRQLGVSVLGAAGALARAQESPESEPADNRIAHIAGGFRFTEGPSLARSVRDLFRAGKYCRSKPLVFSLLPRCQGLCGSQK